MSSSRRQRSRGKPQFPAAWSNWEWNDTYNQYYRYRQIAATGVTENDYQYEYRQPDAPRYQDSDPAVALAAISESAEALEPSQDDAQESSYTLVSPQAGVDNLTLALNRTTLSSVNQKQTPAPAAQNPVNYNQVRERSNSFSAGPSSQNARGGGGFGNRRVITQDSTTNVDLDPAFKVRPSSEFVFGKVFKVLWSEPTGSTGTQITGYRNAKYGEQAYHSIRRFVVVDERYAGHCICLPILTYNGRATTKTGIHARDHAVIFTGKGPSTLKGEKLTKRPIRMLPDSSRHHLDVTSRINYAKVYTVEHNVKVHFIGRISPNYEQQVTTDYNSTHRPLPDRPYSGDMTDDEFGHAEGRDPQYPTRQRSPPSPWAAQTQGSKAVQPSTTIASSYGAPAISSWSTAPTTQPSLYTAQTPYVSGSTSSENYAVPYPATSTYRTPPTTTEPQSQSYGAALTYPQHSGEGEAAGLVAEEATAVETQYDPLYDVSD